MSEMKDKDTEEKGPVMMTLTFDEQDSEKSYRSTEDIVIPKGTIFKSRKGSTTYVENCYSVFCNVSDDTIGELVYGIDPNDPEMKEWFEEVVT